MGVFDAIVIGAGPNGLAAAITLQREGLSVLLLEAADRIGGGARTMELTIPGFAHDVCAAIHPLVRVSPFFNSIPLADLGVEFIEPPVAVAHPLEDAPAAVLYRSADQTAAELFEDAVGYQRMMAPLLEDWKTIYTQIAGPLLRLPKSPVAFSRFATRAMLSAAGLANKHLRSERAKALWAGIAAHSMLPLNTFFSAAPGLILAGAGHQSGWPMIKGGSGVLTEALASYFTSLGGSIEVGRCIRNWRELPEAKVYLFDTAPQVMASICEDKLSSFYKWQLSGYRYGMGVFKIDWALSEPIPFKDEACRRAGTVHLGGYAAAIQQSESDAWGGRHSEQPYVLVAQQSVFDATRAPAGKHTGWAYCHVPLGSQKDMTEIIEAQVERFAPGFRDTILARHSFNTTQMQDYNPNYIMGDISGGVMNWRQLVNRPALRWSPYRTSNKRIYICSSSTPPGGGIHGICGYQSARTALKDVFGIHR